VKYKCKKYYPLIFGQIAIFASSISQSGTTEFVVLNILWQKQQTTK